MINGYLQGARQRFLEFGGFTLLDPASLPDGLANWADSVLVRDEPGLTSLVALVPAAPEGALRGVAAELGELADQVAAAANTEVTALLVIITGEPLTRDEYDRWQALKVNRGAVRIVPWVADLCRAQLFAHQGPPFGIDPDLEMLAAPEPEIAEPEPGSGGQTVRSRTEGPTSERQPPAPVTIVLIAICVGIWLAMTLLNGSLDATENTAVLVRWGALVRPDMWATGEYWRLFTANFLHIGYIHLALNMLSLWVLGRAVEMLYGSRRTAYLFVMAGIGGTVLSSMLGAPEAVAAGASTSLFGFMGALIWYRYSSPLGDRILWRPLLSTLALNLALGLVLHRFIDNWGHLGGLLGGLLASAAIGVPAVKGMRPPRLYGGRWVHVAVAVVLVLGALAVTTGVVELPGPGRELARATDALQQGRLTEARAKLEELARRQPDGPEIHYRLAQTYVRQGNCPQARAELRRTYELVGELEETRSLNAEITAQCRP